MHPMHWSFRRSNMVGKAWRARFRRWAAAPVMATVAALSLSAEPVLSQSADTQQSAKAVEAVQDTDAYRRMMELAQAGNPVAQFNLGVMNDEGIDRPVDPIAAGKWWRLAAENGHVPAQHALALLLVDQESRREIPDYSDALRWLKAAADSGNERSCYTLGKMYEYGLGANRDLGVAADLFRQAAEKGLDRAQYALGKMYRDGRGVEQDAKQAAHWFARAAEQGMPKAQSHLATRLKNGDGIGKDLVKALKWAILAARKGHATAARTEADLRRNLSAKDIKSAELAATEFAARPTASPARGG